MYFLLLFSIPCHISEFLFFNFIKTYSYEKNDTTCLFVCLSLMTFANPYLVDDDLCEKGYTETFSEYATGCNCNGNTITLTGNIDGDTFLPQFATSSSNARRISVPNNVCINIDGVLTISSNVRISLIGGTYNMCAGSEVRVLNGGSLTFGGVTFRGCDEMWKGIYYEENTFFGVENLELNISDALCGLAFNQPRLAAIRNVNFDRNFIGIYAHGNDNQGNGANDYSIFNCTFDCSDPLLPNNTTIPADFNFINLPDLPTTNGWAYTGIIARDLERLPVGPIASGVSIANSPRRNIFTNLSNGVIAQRDVTSVEVDGFLIENLVPERYDFDSYGIYVRRGNTLIVEGDGATDVNTGIVNCKRGIFTDHTPIVLVSNTRMEDTREGIRSEFIEQGTFNIQDNAISGFRNGIYLGASDVTDLLISNNTISMNDEFENDVSGINFQEVTGQLDIVTGATDVVVSDNTLTLTNTEKHAYGILASKTRGALFHDNTILLDNNGAVGKSWRGFFLSKSRDLHIINNQVDATSLDYNQIGAERRSYGMDVFSTIGSFDNNAQGTFFGNIYECNDFDQTTKGIRFDGVCSNTQLVTNIFRDHHTALDYQASAVTGVQRNNGNTWTNQTIPFGAIHDSDNPVVFDDSRFLIHENCNSNPATEFWPCEILTGVGNNNGGNWFLVANVGTPPTCPENYTPHSSNPEQPVSGCNNAFEQAIMNYQATGNGFSDYLGWDLQRSLYRKIVENQLESDPCYKSFYNAVKVESLGAIEDYRADTDYPPTASQATQFSNLNSDIIGLRESIAALTLAIVNATTSQDSTNLMNQRTNTIATLNGEIATRDNLVTTYLTARDAEIAAQSGNNQGIQPINVFETNEQSINTIAESTIMIGNKDLTTTEISEVIQIANLCPLVGGPRAVFTARSILSLLEISQEYSTDCTTATTNDQEDQSTEKEGLNTIFSIVPNPTTTDFTIQYNFTETTPRDLEIYNALGAKVLTRNLSDAIGQLTLSSADLGAGIYYCTLREKGQVIQTEKLIIQK